MKTINKARADIEDTATAGEFAPVEPRRVGRKTGSVVDQLSVPYEIKIKVS